MLIIQKGKLYGIKKEVPQTEVVSWSEEIHSSRKSPDSEGGFGHGRTEETD